MLLENELVEMTWAKRNKNTYINKGYVYTNLGDSFLIKQIDLSPTSRTVVKVECDYCLKIFETKMSNYSRNMELSHTNKASCLKCVMKKVEETNLNKHGVKTNLQLESTKEKIKQTNLDKYGCENPYQNEDIKNKMKNTMIERYGVEYAAQNSEIRKKQVDTSIKKYGVKYTLLNPLVKEKAMKTMFENKTVATSRQQQYLHDLLGGQLNYPIGNYYIDILLNSNIAFEYDGGGHKLQVKLGNVTGEEFMKKERSRDYFLKRRGFKIIRLTSSRDRLPTESILLSSIKKCIKYLNDGGTNSEINLDESYIRFGKNIYQFDYGDLTRKDKRYFELQQSNAN